MSTTPDLRRLPGVPRAVLRADGGRSARHVRTLTGSSDWRRRAVDAVAFARVTALGTAGLPAADGFPWPPVRVEELEVALRHHHPALRVIGAVLPRQRGRLRLSLLCRAAGTPLVVKLGDDRHAFAREHLALEMLARDPLPGIATARPSGTGVLDLGSGAPVAFIATVALGLRVQRPAVDAPLRTFEKDLASRLAGLPARSTGATSTTGTAGLVPVHGDLTPWNLRRTARGLALFDWEGVGWGIPGSDLAHYRRACDEVRRPWRRPPQPSGTPGRPEVRPA